jgi:16S rRNA (cytidine1402-2'-O)-methyltransferase
LPTPDSPPDTGSPAGPASLAGIGREPGRERSEPRPGVLYLVPTPIGNLEDITLRALRVLRQVDWIAAEDTRRTRILLQAHGIQRALFSHHAHNEHQMAPRLVERLRGGTSGALVTDAGMPGVSDPGFLLARAVREAGLAVCVLPGPSAVPTALVASGYPTEPFLFLGYLPATSGRRRRLLDELRDEPKTVVVFETPHRLRRVLAELVERMPQRPLAVCRELTKLHEQVLRGRPSDLLDALPDPPRGEIVLVFSPLGRRDGGASHESRAPGGCDADRDQGRDQEHAGEHDDDRGSDADRNGESEGEMNE